MPEILLVDDNGALRELYAMMLADEGYTVVAVHDGRAALARLRRALPDVLLTDMIMPELDGLGLIDAARSLFPELPIVAMSGGDADSDALLARARDRGACAGLAKPFSLALLRHTLARALAGSASAAPPEPALARR